MPTDAMSNEDMDQLLDQTEAAASAFMCGDPEPYLKLTARSSDYTLFGPFGGAATVGFDAYARAAPLAAGLFSGGSTSLRLIQAYRSGNLAVLVLEEIQQACIAGSPEQDWSLRVTQVYRRESGGWRVVHRHADPMTLRLSPDQAASVARDDHTTG